MDVQTLVAAAGSGAVIEAGIEHTLAGYIPTRLKPVIPVLAGIGMGFVVGHAQGYDPWNCIALGLISAGTAVVKNDSSMSSASPVPEPGPAPNVAQVSK